MPSTHTFDSTWKNCFQSFHYFFCYWALPSFTMNSTHLQIFNKIKIGVACWKTHQKPKLYWFGIQIQRNSICLSTDVLHENVRRLNPLFFEWDVTSHKTTSRHNLNNHKAIIVVHQMEMKSTCFGFVLLSCLLFVGVSCKLGWLMILPISFLVVEMVIDRLHLLFEKLESTYVDKYSFIGTFEREINLIYVEHCKSANMTEISSFEHFPLPLYLWTR